ncbi:hypothetical protein [Halovivax sp.]|uniref:hypothetical protein n=1 Tax=Halovivax sp. TaxID=1935978 RepID=UPI0025BEF4C3|nr:hypothetical protein [Halovivax sp.]
MRSVQITFDCGGADDEWRFLREYVAPAWDRFEAGDAVHSGWFWRAGRFARHDLAELTRETHDLERLRPGQVILVCNGDVEALLGTERPRWESLREAGLLEGWETRRYDPTWEHAHEKLREKYGEVGGRRAGELRAMATGLSVEYLRRFDEPLPAVGEPTAENPVPIAFWSLFHFLAKQHGYDWYDEIDACATAIENRAKSLAAFTTEAEARRTLEGTIAELQDALEAYEAD